MIYMEPSQLGWSALHKTFMLELEEIGMTEIYLTLFQELIDWLVPPIIAIAESCQVVLKTSTMHSYRVLQKFICYLFFVIEFY